MKFNRLFYRCELCGNIIEVIENIGTPVVCCGQKMKPLAPNTVDAAQEKHIPVAAREGDRLNVTVGTVAHPMTREHHISWIAVAQDGLTMRRALDPVGQPSAEFLLRPGAATVYAYCNLHGLWAAELDA